MLRLRSRGVAWLAAAAVAVPLLGFAASQPVTAQAAATATFNDSSLGRVAGTFHYVGRWDERSGGGKYLGDDHASSRRGSYALFRFKGTQLRLYGEKGPEHGLAEARMHKSTTTTFDTYSPTRREGVLLYTSPVLPDDYHVVKVSVQGRGVTGPSGALVALDRAVVTSDDGSAMVPDPTTTTTVPSSTTTSARPTTTSSTTTDTSSPTQTDTSPPPGPSAPAGAYLVVSRDHLMSLPTSGDAWEAMLATARGNPGTANLRDQDNKHAGRVVAAALVYARTGQTAFRDKVVAELTELENSSLDGARVLSTGRQLGGYAVAADLVGYRDSSFMEFLGALRTYELGGHGRWTAITQTSEETSSNWGAWALASRIAVSAYVGDTDDVARAATVFRAFTGDRSAYADFRPTQDFDPSWACSTRWVPINPASCGDRSGALVEDISRSGGSYPNVDETGIMYSWEVLGGATLSARVLARNGYPDVYQWGDKALLRAAQFLHRNGGYPPQYSTNQYTPWEINNAYGTSLGPVNDAGYGRQFGYTDWLR
ncbi:MAG TPA: hypothetical protein VFD41_14335 [Actinomycetales bacterium]|nr:hypothetical protein [Actinomycetales bacterium]